MTWNSPARMPGHCATWTNAPPAGGFQGLRQMPKYRWSTKYLQRHATPANEGPDADDCGNSGPRDRGLPFAHLNVRTEIRLFRAAVRALPGFGQRAEAGSGGDALLPSAP